MSDVKRYTVPGRYLVDNGKNLGAQDVVLATDYATLEAENAKLRAELERRAVDGWKLVPVEPTPEMISAAKEAYEALGDMDIAIRSACFVVPLAAAPSAPKADDPVNVQLLEALECVKQAGFDCGNDGWGVIHLTNDDWQIALAAIAAARKGEGE